MKKMIIAGGSGFLGQALINYFLNHFDEIVILSRENKTDNQHPSVRYVKWDSSTLGNWCNELEGAEVVINLCGKNVNCRYNEANKKEIFRSRLTPTELLANAINQCKAKPEVWFNAVSATIYRHAEEQSMTEANGEIGEGFSVEVCKNWEKAFFESGVKEVRQIALRIAIVLGNEDGLVPRLKNLVRFGLGGKQGNGAQFVSWIHVEDFCRVVDWLISHKDQSGVFNIVAPEPVTNGFLMSTFRKEMNLKFGIPAPVWLLAIGAILIGTETELILKSRRVVPKRLLDSGFSFKYPTITSAVNHLLN